MRDGFQNVSGVVLGRRVVITYENTRYRDERRALREAEMLVSPGLGRQQVLVLVPMNRAVPLISARYMPRAGGTVGSSLALSFAIDDLPSGLWKKAGRSPSFGKLDLVLHPWIEAQFLTYGNPIASRIGVAPELRVLLRPGLSLSAQALLTLQDDIPTGESRIRPALVTFNQTVRLPRNVFVSATVGTFNPDRYGADMEARAYTEDGRFSVGTALGMTGATYYGSDKWLRTPMNEPTALMEASWYEERYDVTVRATGGIFLAGERGARLEAVRRFGELEVGGFALLSEQGTNGGLTLRIPLAPAKRPALSVVRVRAADAFRWEYRYRALVPGGRRYRTGNTLDDFGRQFDPL